MTKFTLVSLIGWLLPPLVAYSLDLLRASDLALGVIVFFLSLWFVEGLRNYVDAKSRTKDLSPYAIAATIGASVAHGIIVPFVHVNYVYHWITVS